MQSLTPGAAFSTTVGLPQFTVGPMAWSIRDATGAVVARGTCVAAGKSVQVLGVLPSNVDVPADGTPYVLVVTDGTTASQVAFSVVAIDDEVPSHGVEVAYVAGRSFADALVTDALATNVTVSVSDCTGKVLVAETAVTTNSERAGSLIWKYAGGVLSPATGQSMATGTSLWEYDDDDGRRQQEVHAFYTITPYSLEWLNVIRKLVDRARLGDAHRYLEVTVTDLAHALVRGCEFVASSPPFLTPFTLDGLPITLRDYITKAGAIDLLRSLQLAEGLSAFDFTGLGVQLNVDRSSHYGDTISALQADLDKLVEVKKAWMAAGSPMGAIAAQTRRPIGALLLTTGVYSNQPSRTLPFVYGWGNASFYGFGRLGGGGAPM